MPPIAPSTTPLTMSATQHHVNSLTCAPIHFLDLPLELRTMVYSLLLTSCSDIFVPCDIFKRGRKMHRQSLNRASNASRDPAVPFFCNTSSKVACPHRSTNSRLLHPSHNDITIDTAILLTCHQINTEASPTLYQWNTFHFEDSNVASSFRWSTNPTLAGQISSLHIVHMPGYFNANPSPPKMLIRDQRHYEQWNKYIETTEAFSLSNDFLHLKYLTLTFGRGLEVPFGANRRPELWVLGRQGPDLRPAIESWASSLQGRLKWVQIIGLNNEILLSYFFPLVWQDVPLQNNNIPHNQSHHDHYPQSRLTEAEDDEVDLSDGGAADAVDDRKPRVHMHVSEYAARPGWKNAVIWWGTSTTPPCQIRPFEGDPRWRRRLYRINGGNGTSRSMIYTVGESYSQGLD